MKYIIGLSLLVFGLMFMGNNVATDQKKATIEQKLIPSNYDTGTVFQNFDNFQPTGEKSEPQDSTDGWRYESKNSCKFVNSTPYKQNQKTFNFISNYVCKYNNAHMGYTTFGFPEIDGIEAIKGNSLKFVTTGGVNNTGEHGKPLHNKKTYLEYLEAGENPISMDGEKVGHPYIYFQNNSKRDKRIPFEEAQNKNRLSLYIKLPEKDIDTQEVIKMTIGPYTGVGGHWYHNFINKGGGWMHIVVGSHPNHNNAFHNASKYPYPSYSVRDMGVEYFNKMYRFYITFSPYEGIATPPYSIWFDEIEFYYDAEPQNNETVNSPAISFNGKTSRFEICFKDKYKNNETSNSKYELRYSFSQIDNSNYINAFPVIIMDDPNLQKKSFKPGIMIKQNPNWQTVWALFKLAPADEARLTAGRRIYFAVKDISNRPYKNQTFDEEGDTSIIENTGSKRRIDLIKRIDFLIPKSIKK